MAYETLNPPAGVSISPGSEVAFEPRVNRAEFGDGYVQRSGDGINGNPAKLSASFEVVRGSEATALLDFFAAKKGYIPFLFTLPDETTPRQWLATKWRKAYTGKKISSISVDLEENFDP